MAIQILISSIFLLLSPIPHVQSDHKATEAEESYLYVAAEISQGQGVATELLISVTAIQASKVEKYHLGSPAIAHHACPELQNSAVITAGLRKS